jgi:hypothetical protein
MKEVVVVLLVSIAVVLGITWIAQGSDFFLYKVFAPKYEEVRRQTFEETKSYNDGMVQELQNMRFEYIKADAEQKKALAPIIRHRAANYPCERMPADLCTFVNSLGN